jgi:hypothetical protein
MSERAVLQGDAQTPAWLFSTVAQPSHIHRSHPEARLVVSRLRGRATQLTSHDSNQSLGRFVLRCHGNRSDTQGNRLAPLAPREQPFNTLQIIPTDPKQDLRLNLHLAACISRLER